MPNSLLVAVILAGLAVGMTAPCVASIVTLTSRSAAADAVPNLGPLHIVAVGDTHTLHYAGDALRDSFRTVGIAVDVTTILTDSLGIAGIASDAATSELGVRVLQGNPDVVVIMMGATDAAQGNLDGFRDQFSSLLREVKSYAASRSELTQLLIAANIPIPSDAAASAVLRNTLNPWLRAEATASDWIYVDLQARMINIANWPNLYSDGTLLTPHGYDWMTVTIRNQIMELPFPEFIPVPEPHCGLLLLGTCGGLLAWRRSGR